jgi:hypothetical protein
MRALQLRSFPAGAGISDRVSSPFAKGAQDEPDSLRMTAFKIPRCAREPG